MSTSELYKSCSGTVSIATTAIYTHLTEPIRASLTGILDELMTGL